MPLPKVGSRFKNVWVRVPLPPKIGPMIRFCCQACGGTPHFLDDNYAAAYRGQKRSRVSPAIRGRVPPPQKFIFYLKMVSFGALWVVFYVI